MKQFRRKFQRLADYVVDISNEPVVVSFIVGLCLGAFAVSVTGIRWPW